MSGRNEKRRRHQRNENQWHQSMAGIIKQSRKWQQHIAALIIRQSVSAIISERHQASAAKMCNSIMTWRTMAYHQQQYQHNGDNNMAAIRKMNTAGGKYQKIIKGASWRQS